MQVSSHFLKVETEVSETGLQGTPRINISDDSSWSCLTFSHEMSEFYMVANRGLLKGNTSRPIFCGSVP